MRPNLTLIASCTPSTMYHRSCKWVRKAFMMLGTRWGIQLTLMPQWSLFWYYSHDLQFKMRAAFEVSASFYWCRVPAWQWNCMGDDLKCQKSIIIGFSTFWTGQCSCNIFRICRTHLPVHTSDQKHLHDLMCKMRQLLPGNFDLSARMKLNLIAILQSDWHCSSFEDLSGSLKSDPIRWCWMCSFCPGNLHQALWRERCQARISELESMVHETHERASEVVLALLPSWLTACHQCSILIPCALQFDGGWLPQFSSSVDHSTVKWSSWATGAHYWYMLCRELSQRYSCQADKKARA